VLHLEPNIYPCPTHGDELRPLVERALDREGPPAAYGGKKKPFTVFVSCPGGGEPHPQVCKGRYWR
jgi:hypothetical protein